MNVTYQLDKNASRFTVRAFTGGMLSAMGHNPTIAIRDFSGEAHIDPDAPEKGSVKLRVRADSLEVTDDLKSKDRLEMESTMNQKVLETTAFPDIAYVGAAISATRVSDGRFQVRINGNLLLHGVTGDVPLTVQVSLMGDMLRASGDFSLLQSDFGILSVSVAGGALKLKDELKFAFDIIARRQE